MPRHRQPGVVSHRRCAKHDIEMVMILDRGTKSGGGLYRCPKCVEIARAKVEEETKIFRRHGARA